MSAAPLLHVTNGDSVVGTLRAAGVGGSVLAWKDVLHEGPVPRVDPETLRGGRARFLSECGCAVQLFVANQQAEEAPFDGDSWVWRHLARLAPLVAAVDDRPIPLPPPRGDHAEFASTPFVLTDAGRAVLEGAEDAVELLGMDRWLGGTHLEPGNVWRWDPEAGRVVPPRQSA